MDHIEVRGSTLIDTIAMSHGVMEYVEGSRLMECNEIIFTDHRAYIVDINLNNYFDDQISEWDQINRVVLSLSRRSHRNKFNQSLSDQL